MIPWVAHCPACGEISHVAIHTASGHVGHSVVPTTQALVRNGHEAMTLQTPMGTILFVTCPFVARGVCEECGNDDASVLIAGRNLCTDCAEREP